MIATSQLLKQARRYRRLTPAQTAILAEVAPSTISRIESGKMQPSYDLMRSILISLGFDGSDQLRPQVTTEQMIKFFRSLTAGRIPQSQIYTRLRITAQVSPVLDRPGVQFIDADLRDIVTWVRESQAPYAVSGLEACSNDVSFEPIVYTSADVDLPCASPQRSRGLIVLPLGELEQELVTSIGEVRTMPPPWALMDAIASPGRQSDVGLDILAQYEAADAVAA